MKRYRYRGGQTHWGVVDVSAMMTNTRRPGRPLLLMNLLPRMKKSIPQKGRVLTGTGLQKTLGAQTRSGSHKQTPSRGCPGWACVPAQ